MTKRSFNKRSFALTAGVALLVASPLALVPVMAQTGTGTGTGTTPGGSGMMPGGGTTQPSPMTPGVTPGVSPGVPGGPATTQSVPSNRAPTGTQGTAGSLGAPGLFSPDAATTNSWRASTLIGQSIYNRANERIGEVNELVIDRDGRVAAAIIGVGGFLGLGERNVAVNFSAIQMNTDGANANNNTPRAMIDIDRNALREAPEFRRPENWAR